MSKRKAVKQKPVNDLPIPRISHKKFLQIDRNYERAASVADLVYVSDSKPGISRLKKGRGYVYMYQDRPVRKKEDIERIRAIVIPPAWTSVWICPIANGHLQATGIDLRQRKQYRYHVLWSMLRNETKFHRLFEFGKVLPALRDRLETDLADRELTDKKGKTHNITLKSKRLSRIVQHCRDIPGKELFQYVDSEGKRRPIDSGMINNYIKEATGKDFTSKDFRTWAGTLHLLLSLKSIGEAVTKTETKQNIVKALDEVSLKLGNTRTVCRKYYVHPGLIELYEKNNLQQYFKKLDKAENRAGKNELTQEEEVLMEILHSFHT